MLKLLTTSLFAAGILVAAPVHAELVSVTQLGKFIDTSSDDAGYWKVKYLGGANTGNRTNEENFNWQTARATNSEEYKDVYSVGVVRAGEINWNVNIPWISPYSDTVGANGYYSYKASFDDKVDLSGFTDPEVQFNGLSIDFASDDHLHAILINGEVYPGFSAESFDYPGWTQKLTHIWMTDIAQWWNVGGTNTIEFIVHNNNSGSNYRDNLNPTGFSADIQAAYLVRTNNIPEPETYAMMLVGLSIVGMIARRRKQV
ncbi:MAG: PEP-CTERM sorting domain-containing protein [Betaproteobacteria bacterium]|nr:PEP-CTERM sorting domain-containing protein [Betaproteobacteria bacterium]